MFLVWSAYTSKLGMQNRGQVLLSPSHPVDKLTIMADATNRLIATFGGTVRETPERVFSLCCPTREEEWIDGWNESTYRLIHSESGFNEDNCVFQECSLKPFLFGEPGPTTWITTSFQPERCSLEFMLIFGDTAVINRRVHVGAAGDDNAFCPVTGPGGEPVRDRLTDLTTFESIRRVVREYSELIA